MLNITSKKSIELIAKLIVCGFKDLKSGKPDMLVMRGKHTYFVVCIHKHKPIYGVYDLRDPYDENKPVCEKINYNSVTAIISAMT